MDKFQISNNESEYTPPSIEEEKVYSYGDDTLEEMESSERSINDDEILSDNSSSSSEGSTPHRSSLGKGTGMPQGKADGAGAEVAEV